MLVSASFWTPSLARKVTQPSIAPGEQVRKHVNDLYEDLRDGHNLISLLEVLSGDTLPRERDFLKTLRLVSASEACEYEQHEDMEDEDKGPRERGRMRFHRLQNVQIALDYLKRRQV
ncbi:hypothetical protein Celaphus_00014180 [Cervus elaphus hippelaphus]|uniref:Calponin-homology (CH) domain-containing protein n=1 Tax=Cervus elaphus hippelaphus TaxID=46360 RepID=A0A212D463_CEREH|nr:hypothetical protein Celaphus_00014180 [Cervus elaphus hippelaphus]